MTYFAAPVRPAKVYTIKDDSSVSQLGVAQLTRGTRAHGSCPGRQRTGFNDILSEVKN